MWDPKYRESHNIKKVQNQYHKAWHTIFHNWTPIEVIDFLVNTVAEPGAFAFMRIRARWEHRKYAIRLHKDRNKADPFRWNTKRKEAAWRRLFQGKDIFWVICEIVESWAPLGYFTFVELRAKRGRRRLYYRRN